MTISAKNLTKVYNNKPCRNVGKGLFNIEKSNFALKDISFDIKRGECVGVIGKNGAGKSTLLKLICGITSATSGSIVTNGRISALLELGSGFNPEYSGISNIYLNCTIQGLSKKEADAIIPEIIAFADIGSYINMPVKTYSDGMFLRLAFACAIAVKPDILIIDEALAVGDFSFRQKCFNKIEAMKNEGVTIIMVSHDIDAIRRMCPRTIWIDKGALVCDGDTASISAEYMKSITGDAPLSSFIPHPAKKACSNRFGSAIGSIISAELPPVLQTDNSYSLICTLDIPNGVNLESLALSMAIKDRFGLDLTVVSTADLGIFFEKTGKCTAKIAFDCLLCSGEYSVCLSLEDRSEHPIKYYDYADGIQKINVYSSKDYLGTFFTPCKISLSYGDE